MGFFDWFTGGSTPAKTPQPTPQLTPDAEYEAKFQKQLEEARKQQDAEREESRKKRCQTCGGAKEKYKTSREAAVAQMQEYSPKTGQDGYEYGGFINKNEDGTFSPGETYRAENPNAPVDIGEQGPNADSFWHTHPADPAGSPGYNDIFWQGDANVSKVDGVPGYVATPNGDIRYYDPASGYQGVTNQYNMTDYGTVIPDKAPR
jgi:hypothetical protein